jgi:deoxyribonuclease-4
MKELIIGSHVSFKKNDQLIGSVKEALKYNSNTFMFYTGAPQNTNRAIIDNKICQEAWDMMKENGIDINNVVVHAPYIINLANNGINYEFAINFLKEEIRRTEQLGIKNLVLHPGSHVSLGTEKGIENIINGLNMIIDGKTNVNICLETMAGKGSEIGSSFEEIRTIIDGVKYNDKIKVCLDTCHINDAGYDISDFDAILDEFDNIIGLDKLACIHVNDSKNDKGAHKDRHENFGFGTLGFDNLINIVYNPRIANIPKILETPYVSADENSKERLYPPYKLEIEMIRNKKINHNLIDDIRNYYK